MQELGLSAPKGFIRFSHAVERLKRGMWGSVPQPSPLRKIKSLLPRASIGFGPWRERAAQSLTRAVKQGRLPLYVTVSSESKPAIGPKHARHPVQVPIKVVARLMTSRGGISNHAIRPSVRTVDGDMRLLGLLTVGLFVLRKSEFVEWYRFERSKGKWPSQHSRVKKRPGRPTKKTQTIRNAIVALAYEGRWTAKDGIAHLRRLLLAAGHADAPSHDTLRRLVSEMHDEMGDQELLLKKRFRSKLPSKAS